MRRFWDAPHIATHEGLKAVQMFDAIERGEIKALWVMATNPAVSLPRAGAVRDALKKLELFVVSENVLSNDTVNAGAHILLPAAAWGEKDGTVTNSERRISRQRRFLPPPGEAKPDWWIVSEVARRMGFADAFAYAVRRRHLPRARRALGVRERRHARFRSRRARATSMTPPSTRSIRCTGRCAKASTADATRFFADGGFFTPDRKARFIAPEAPALRDAASDAYPFVLNTGRVRDQWHTMTRTGLSPRLGQHMPEPFVEVHPADARVLRPDAISRASRPRMATASSRCALSDGQRRGSLFVPIHWNGETASSARVGDLVAPHTDPYSGQPEAKATPARDRAGRIRLSRLRADARRRRAAGRHLVGARRAAAAASAPCSRPMTAGSAGASMSRMR